MNPISNAQLQDTLVRCIHDTRVFGSTFMPNRFWRPWRSAHEPLFNVLDNDDIPLAVVAAPRGLGKTTVDSIAYPAKKVLFRQSKFIELVSATATVAAQNVKNLGRELTGNADIVRTFGNIKGPIWSEGRGDLETNTGIKILARGAGQQIRGLLEGDSRPDLIICDDLEDPEPFRIGDPTEYLRKIKEWFWSDLMNSIDRRGHTRVIVVGTILHEDSLLQNLLDDPEWVGVRMELCDDSYNSNFPDLMPTEEVKRMAAAFKARGMLDVFFREYRNLAIAAEDASFKEAMFRYYNTEYNPVADFGVDRCVIVDPAKSLKLHSAYTAIVGVGFDSLRNRIYLIDCVNEKMKPSEIYKTAFEMAQRLRTHTIGVEVTSLGTFISYPFNNYLQKRNFPAIIELNAVVNKLERIKQLSPFYEMGLVYHNPLPEVHDVLETQLKTFPRSKFLDVADAMAYCIPMFNLGEKFFGMSEQEDEEAIDEEIRELDEMEANIERLAGNFRISP